MRFATLAIAVLSGCTTIKNVFDGRGKDKSTDPTPLVQITPVVTVSKVWGASVGKGEDKLGIGQHPTIVDGRVYAAALEGGVSAFDLRTGQPSGPPAIVPVTVHTVRIEGDDVLVALTPES